MRTLVFLVSLIFWTTSWSSQSTRSSAGRELRWTSPFIPIVIRTNSQTMNSVDVQTIIQNSMAQWNAASPTKIVPVTSSVNEIRFLQDFSKYGSGIIGITELSHNEAGGVYKGLIHLNEENFVFSATQAFQSSTSRIFLGNVITHELGHLMGLAHSEVLDASMFYAGFRGQSSIAFDDRAGILQKYDAVNFGSISGYVKGGSHIGVLGVHVQAISRSSGEIASTITDENGAFTLGGLDLQDTYYIYTSPLKHLASLPKSYSNVQSEFCPGSYLGSFFTACGADGEAQGISLTSSEPHASVGVISISCALKSSPAYSYEKIQSTFSPLTIFDFAEEARYEKSFMGYFRNLEVSHPTDFSPPDKFHIDLSGFSEIGGSNKFVQFKIISQPLGNALEFRLDVKQNLVSLFTEPIVKTQPAPDYKYQIDLTSIHSLSSLRANNVFDLEVAAHKLTEGMLDYTMPNPNIFAVNSNWPYLVVVSLLEMTPNGLRPLVSTEALLSDNSACLEAPFTYAVAKTEVEEQGEATTKAANLASCGTIEPPDSNGPSSHLFILSIGFLLVALTTQVRKRAKKLLS